MKNLHAKYFVKSLHLFLYVFLPAYFLNIVSKHISVVILIYIVVDFEKSSACPIQIIQNINLNTFISMIIIIAIIKLIYTNINIHPQSYFLHNVVTEIW